MLRRGAAGRRLRWFTGGTAIAGLAIALVALAASAQEGEPGAVAGPCLGFRTFAAAAIREELLEPSPTPGDPAPTIPPCPTPTPTPTNTPTATNTPTRTNTPTATNTLSVTPTKTPTPTRTPSPTPTVTQIPQPPGLVLLPALLGGAGPHGVAYVPSRDEFWVVNLHDRIDIFNATTLLRSTVTHGTTFAADIVVSPDSSRAYIALDGYGGLVVYDTTTRQQVGFLNLPGERPHGLAISPDGSRLYLCLLEPSMPFVRVVDTGTLQVVGTITLGDVCDAADVSRDGRWLWVATLAGGGQAYAVDTSTNTVMAVVPLPSQPKGMQVSPDGRRAYTSLYLEDRVAIIDTASRTIVGYYNTGDKPEGLGLSPDGSTLWAGNNNSNSVSVFYTPTGQLLTTLLLDPFSNPHQFAFRSDGTRALITSMGTQNAPGSGANYVVDIIP